MHEGEGRGSAGVLLALALLGGAGVLLLLSGEQATTPGGQGPETTLGQADDAAGVTLEASAGEGAAARPDEAASLVIGADDPAGGSRAGAQIVGERAGQATLAPGTASLRGRVVDSAGRGVAGARVQVRSQPGAGGGMREVRIQRGPDGATRVERRGEQRSAAVETDAQGAYTLTKLPAELQGSLHVEPPEGFLPGRAPLPTLTADATTDAPDVVLLRPASLSGVVVDETGQPIAGAGVRIDGGLFLFMEPPAEDDEASEDAPGEGAVTRTTRSVRVVAGGAAPSGRLDLDAAPPPATRSDDQGRWRLEGVEPGTHTLIATQRGRRTGRLEDVEAVEGRETGDLTLELAAGYRVVVDCVDTTGRPIDGARVDAFALHRPGRSPQATTDPAGRAVVEGLAEAEVQLVVAAEGYAPYQQQVTLSDDAEPIEVVLRPGVTLVGRAVRGDGTPVAGAFAWVEPLVFEGGRLEIRADDEEGRSGEDGRFTLRGVAPGSYRLHLRAAGLAEGTHDVQVTAGRDEVDLGDVTLPELCAVEVTVLDPEGQPVSGAEVSTASGLMGGMAVMVNVEEETETDDAGDAGGGDDDRGGAGGGFTMGGMGRARSGDDGRATLDGLDPGEVRLEARKAGLGSGRSDPIALEPGQRAQVTIRLEPAARVEGTLLRADGTPAGGQPLLLAPDAGNPATDETDAEGRFAFADVAPGRYRLRAMRGQLADAAGEAFDVPAGQTTRRTARLVAGARLTGVVRGPNGEPLADASVVYGRLMPLSDAASEVMPVAETRSGPDGRYELADLVPGEAQHGVSVRPRGAEQGATFAVEVAPDGTTRDLRLPAAEGAAVTITALDGGAPAPGARIVLETAGDGPLLRRSRAAGSDGQVTFSDVPAGRYAVHAEADGRARASGEVVVEGAGPVAGPALALGPEGALLLEVGGLGDMAWPVVRLTLTRADAPHDTRQLMLRPDQPTRIGGLTVDAAYTLRVSGPGADPVELEARAVANPGQPLRIELPR